MPDESLTARDLALKHLIAARDTNVRGELAEAIKTAISIADGTAASEKKRTGLTAKQFENLKPGKKLVDPHRRGLMMRAGKGKNAPKKWIFRFSHPETGKQIEHQFGRYPDMTFADAIEEWKELREMRNRGDVPNQKSNDADKSVGLTIGELSQRYLAEYARKVKAPSSVREDARIIDRHILPNYEHTNTRDFTDESVAAILHPLDRAGKSRQAEQVAAVIRVMFNVARGRTKKISMLGQRTWLPKDHPNPADNIGLKRHESEIYLPTDKELKNYAKNLHKLGRYGVILRLQLETFARIGEVTGMRWDEVDLENAIWELPAQRSKNGFAHKVMLADQTVDLLNELHRNRGESDYVFPAATDPTKPIDRNLVLRNLANARDHVDEKTGDLVRGPLGVCDKFTSHATRRLSLTWIANHQGHKEIRDRLSNHTANKNDADSHYTAMAERNGDARKFTQLWVNRLSALRDENIATPDFGGQRNA
ncbi:tyrosine-type recombinase/integrase [Ruegeria atlantica]|uniref:Prophage CP4-57 integrase n=1 Tax=Ruegeria atlantica TaxID=81569 RepID=A0A0P1ELQ8_9RHOB|nr:tyrosine-type recombinase/integrase [Ruegeria atlantica]CUH42067.1 Prophage CP4-57 integrase [Ruegeria atlantica]